MPSFSSTLSLMREIVSSLSMSISISLPVSVFTLICHRSRHLVSPTGLAKTPVRLASRRGTHVHGSNRWLDGLRRFSVSEPAQARRTCQAAGSFSELWPPRGAWFRDGRAPRPLAQRLVARVWPPWPPDGAQAGPVREREGAEAPARGPRQQRRQRLRGWVSGWGQKENNRGTSPPDSNRWFSISPPPTSLPQPQSIARGAAHRRPLCSPASCRHTSGCVARRRLGQSPCAPLRAGATPGTTQRRTGQTPAARTSALPVSSAWQMAVGKNKRLSKGKKGKGKKV